MMQLKKSDKINQKKYKIFLLVLKYLPYFLMLIDIVNTFLQRPMVGYIGGVSYLGILFMLLTSLIFNFCSYHRVPLYYLFINNTLNFCHVYFSLNTQNLDEHLATIGISVLLMTFLYCKEKDEPVQFKCDEIL